MSEIKIVLPLPFKELSPNARCHWAAKAKSVKNYRLIAWGQSKLELPKRHKPWMEAEAQATFYHKSSRKRDRDNALASLKSAFDGIADAKVIRDDSGLTHKPVVFAVDKSNPRVVIVIRPLTSV